ncbi:MerR family transcriptional regulator [Brevibacterium album]|uniref:MerR family transcriptional regulator n=1 Tax=Brevibacterium album TaxID=417948 RepID=UPI000406E2A7|nr:MerR family transcriptional regulator [Brevibacterium album]
MRIGELAERSGVSIRSLRYYEEQHLLTPARLPSGYRVYDEPDVLRVRRIQVLLAAGLSTRRIVRVLPCLTQHDGGLALSCGDLYNELVAERDELLARMDALRASAAALDAVISASPRPD